MKARSYIVVISFVLLIQFEYRYMAFGESQENNAHPDKTAKNGRTGPEKEASSQETDQEPEVTKKLNPDAKDPEATEEQAQRDLATFRKLFLQKRGQHIQAVDSLLETYEYQKTYQMVELLLTRMRTVVGTSRETLIQTGFEPGMPFPSDDDTKDALAMIMENAGLFSDMALKLPDITHACLAKKKSKVSEILKWSISYSQDTGFLDEMNTQLFHLASQELEMVPKDPDFINPYKQDHNFEQHQQSEEKKKKPKAEKKRGPRVTKVEL